MKNIDVFISHHTRTCLKITEAVCNALESKGIRVWYAPRDTEDAYARSIVEAINNCKVFLLILNKETSYSEDCLNEINLAVERLRKGEEIYIIPFHISEEDISPDAKYYIGRLHWIDAINPPIEERITEVADRIFYLLNNKKDVSEESGNNIKIKSSNIQVSANFLGRKKEIEELENILNNNHLVALQGMGGIGKSEIAKKYAQSHSDKYKIIIFAVYENSLKKMIIDEKYFIIQGLERKMNEDGSKESDDQFYTRKIDVIRKNVDYNTLLIIDNFDTDKDENIKDILDLPLNIIFTTRNDLKKYQIPTILINAFSNEEEQLELFMKHYEIPFKTDEEKEEVKEILNEVKGHTLSIRLLANLMNESRIKPKVMLEKLQTKGIDESIGGGINYNYHEFASIYQCISCVFSMASLTEDEKKILKYLSIFPTDGVDFELFMEVCDLESGEIINNLIKKSLIQHDHVKDVISLHPVINSVIKNELKVTFSDISIILDEIGKNYEWGATYDVNQKYVTIIKRIYDEYPNITIESGKLFIECLDYLVVTGELDYAEKIILGFMDVANEEEDIARLCDKYAYVLTKKVKYDLAIEYIEKGTNLAEKLKDNKLLLDLYHLKTSIYKYKNDANSCFECINKMKEVVTYLTPKDIERVETNSHYNLISVYRINKEYEKALQCANETYELMAKDMKNRIADISGVYREKGFIYYEMGKYNECIKNILKSDEIMVKHFTEYEPRRISMLETLGDAYLKINEKEKAKETFNFIKEYYEKYYSNIDEKIKQINEKIDEAIK